MWTSCAAFFLAHVHNNLIRTKLGALLVNTLWAFLFLVSFLACFAHSASIFPFFPHTLLSPVFLRLASSHAVLLPSPQSAFLQQATGFTFATSILVKLMAVVAHKAGTQCCDVARCPTAALHNPVWSMCWLDRSVFTQAPGACHDPAAATLRGRLAVHCVTHRRAAVWGKLVLWAAKHPPGIFYHCPRVRLYCQSLVWNIWLLYWLNGNWESKCSQNVGFRELTIVQK